MEILQEKYNNPSLARYGRSGQTQDGIDGIDLSHNPGGLAWQATLQVNGLDKKLVGDLGRARKSTYDPSRYVFVSAARRDTALAKAAGRLSTPACQVEVLFWDDLWIELTKWPDIFERYYGWWLRPRPWWESGTLLLLLLAIAALVGGAAWVVLWRKVGGTDEPHGLWAAVWAIGTNLPVCVVSWLFSRRAGVSYSETSRFLVGLVAGSWFFYDLPLGHHRGIRHTLESLDWSPVATEALMVVIWSATLAAFANVFASLGRPLLVKSLVYQVRRKLIALLMSVLFTSIPVWIFVSVFPTVEFQVARGVIAGIALRIGLGLGMAMPFFEALYLRRKIPLWDARRGSHQAT